MSKKVQVFELVPCPPMKAKMTEEACVAIFESGEKEVCRGCGLGPARGAREPWEYKGTIEQRARWRRFAKRYGFRSSEEERYVVSAEAEI